MFIPPGRHPLIRPQEAFALRVGSGMQRLSMLCDGGRQVCGHAGVPTNHPLPVMLRQSCKPPLARFSANACRVIPQANKGGGGGLGNVGIPDRLRLGIRVQAERLGFCGGQL